MSVLAPSTGTLQATPRPSVSRGPVSRLASRGAASVASARAVAAGDASGDAGGGLAFRDHVRALEALVRELTGVFQMQLRAHFDKMRRQKYGDGSNALHLLSGNKADSGDAAVLLATPADTAGSGAALDAR